jgi:hypothetical protein
MAEVVWLRSSGNVPKQAKPRKLIAPPDLQALVEAWGGYDKVSSRAWAEYDAELAKWQSMVRDDSPLIEEPE